MLSKRFTSNRKSSGHHYTRDILQSIVDNHLLDLISIQVTALDGVSQAPHVNEFVHIEVDTIELLKVLDLRNRKRCSITCLSSEVLNLLHVLLFIARLGSLAH